MDSRRESMLSSEYMQIQDDETDDETRMPLLPSRNKAASPLAAPPPATPTGSAGGRQRLQCLDAMRGLTICLMVLVDTTGNWFGNNLGRPNAKPSVWFGMHHSPWDGVSSADFVMPFFLFMVGCSMSLAFRKYHEKKLPWRVLKRTAKLYLLGLLVQSGNLFDQGGQMPSWWNASQPLPAGDNRVEDIEGIGSDRQGYDLKTLRLSGILQRIAFAYLAVSLMALYLPTNVRGTRGSLEADFASCPGPLWSRSFRFYRAHWLVAFLFVGVYTALTFGLYVPTWTPPGGTEEVVCDVRGDLSPKCSAARYVDQTILGWKHMCPDLFAHRRPECSSCYPENCPILPPTPTPAWCHAPFESEGLLATLPTVLTTWLGMHFGLVLHHYKPTHSQVYITKFWLGEAVMLVVVGIIIHVAGWPMNKQLWSPAYLFYTAGATGYMPELQHNLLVVRAVGRVSSAAPPVPRANPQLARVCFCVGLARADVLWHKPRSTLNAWLLLPVVCCIGRLLLVMFYVLLDFTSWQPRCVTILQQPPPPPCTKSADRQHMLVPLLAWRPAVA